MIKNTAKLYKRFILHIIDKICNETRGEMYCTFYSYGVTYIESTLLMTHIYYTLVVLSKTLTKKNFWLIKSSSMALNVNKTDILIFRFQKNQLNHLRTGII